MKKLNIFVSAVVCGAAVLGACACGGENDNATPEGTTVYSVYAPDGAPALALAGLLSDPSVSALSAAPAPSYKFKTTIVKADTVRTTVTGESPKADFCILPVNLAATLLGTAETYQMLGTVTNGNMYLLTTGDNPAITTDNLSTLKGKTVGVVQLNNVPGLTLQAVLKKTGVDYAVLGNDDSAASDKVNLRAFADATMVGPSAGCDYYLCPEPAVTGKIATTASTGNPFKLAGDLQELYGGGYPQAVMVAKKSVISGDKAAVSALINKLEASGEFLENAEASSVLSALTKAYETGLKASFNANNLTKEVISHCSVKFTPSKDCKEKVNTFLGELIDVNPSFTKAVAEGFFYLG